MIDNIENPRNLLVFRFNQSSTGLLDKDKDKNSTPINSNNQFK